jgi:hypothetical protein
MERNEGPAIDNADSGTTVAQQRSTANIKKEHTGKGETEATKWNRIKLKLNYRYRMSY